MKYTISPKNQRTITLEMLEDDFYVLLSSLDVAKGGLYHHQETNERFRSMYEKFVVIKKELE